MNKNDQKSPPLGKSRKSIFWSFWMTFQFNLSVLIRPIQYFEVNISINNPAKEGQSRPLGPQKVFCTPTRKFYVPTSDVPHVPHCNAALHKTPAGSSRYMYCSSIRTQITHQRPTGFDGSLVKPLLASGFNLKYLRCCMVLQIIGTINKLVPLQIICFGFHTDCTLKYSNQLFSSFAKYLIGK
jgi:hypothetical protein